jgi:CRISPR/Cas system endoribonuclease Cas6 (RAMP superfamily)
MNYLDFVEKCRQIVETHDQKLAEGYELKPFTLGTGGVPRNHAKIEYVEQLQEYRYDTSRNGEAWSSETIVLCKDTGLEDKLGRKIYQTFQGKMFTWEYQPGDPANFDDGWFSEPEL